MTDYFALFDEARRPWLDADQLKEKYFALSRTAAADAELNEAFRVLSDPKTRLHHLLTLEGAELTVGRAVPSSVAELFWNAGTLLREGERWLLKSAGASSTLSRALLSSERIKLEGKLQVLAEQLNTLYEREIDRLRQMEVAANNSPESNDFEKLIELYDAISYLTRLREQTAEKRFRMTVA